MPMNTILQPSRSTFWRFVLLATALLPVLAAYQTLGRASQLGVDVSASRPWMALIAALALLGLLLLSLFALSWSRYGERLYSLAEFPERLPGALRWIGAFLFGIALTGFVLVFMVPFIRNYLGSIGWIRFLVFWSFS